MDPRWRNRIITGGALGAALWIGGSLAHGKIAAAALGMAASVAALVAWGRWARIETLALSFLLVGYIVGNRGFAQIMPIPQVPLLFGEGVLALGLAMLLWRSALTKRLPLHRDGLNAVLLVLLGFGGIRMIVDFPRDGFLAVRDFATIYYIGFFFLAQELARHRAERRWLMHALTGAFLVLPWTLAANRLFPDFFLETLTIRGVPVIFYKDDLAATFLIAGVFLLLEPPAGRAAVWRWFGAAAALIAGALSLSRAALAGLIAATGIALGAGRRRFAILCAVLAPVGLVASIAITISRGESWEQSKAYALYEHAISIVDLSGAATYRNGESADSGFNNRFRLVWWRTIIDRVLHENPMLGLGFGYDLARDFVAVYDRVSDDFDTRSPHSILFTIFGRMGLLGLVLLIAAAGVMGRATWREVRRVRSDSHQGAEVLSLWCAAWVIFVSACFGVVLEGPMGAVVFWTMLGLAHGSRLVASDERRAAETQLAEALPATAPSRPRATTAAGRRCGAA